MKTKVLIAFLFFASFARAQVSPEVFPTDLEPLPINVLNWQTPAPLAQNDLPNIVLIGYWPPTNEMVRRFDHRQRDLWEGENWEGRGYNIYAFFSEFGPDTPQGVGAFQVDYQATSNDFWNIVPLYSPVAVLSFGRSSANKDWEIEMVTRNLTYWNPDFVPPLRPEVAPPDESFARDGERLTEFPGDAIVEALRSEVPALNAFTDRNGAGAYLCEYLGFHLSWYRELNPDRVRFAAHTHIGSNSNLETLSRGMDTMLRVLCREIILMQIDRLN
ncbi:MAG: hypothetical protein R2827_03560 [Bdellovibrionales bacterium]